MAAYRCELLDGGVRRYAMQYGLLEALLLAVVAVHAPKESIALDGYEHLLEHSTAPYAILAYAAPRGEYMYAVLGGFVHAAAILIATAAVDHAYQIVATRYPVYLPVAICRYKLKRGTRNGSIVHYSLSFRLFYTTKVDIMSMVARVLWRLDV